MNMQTFSQARAETLQKNSQIEMAEAALAGLSDSDRVHFALKLMLGVTNPATVGVLYFAARQAGDHANEILRTQYESECGYLINHVIAFDGIADGIVIIDAPLDTYLDNAVLQLATDAVVIDRQLAQCKQLRDLTVAA